MLQPEKRSLVYMNGDDSQRLLEDGACLNIMNGSVAASENGRDKRLENRPGTTAITQSVYPAGAQQCLGGCTDEQRHRILFFMWNSTGEHGIYCFDYSTPSAPVVYAVLYSSQITGGLSLSKSYRVDRNCNVVGDLLYWTDNTNQPRRINIEAGIKLNHPTYSTTVTAYTNPLAQSVITIIRRPFGLPVSATKITDGGVTENFIDTYSGQAASRLIYRDGEYSVLSVPSPMVTYNLNTETYNAIDFAFPMSEVFVQDVQIIQLAVRYGNSPQYFVVKEWNKAVAADLAEINAHNAGSVALTFRFYNNKIGVPISNADSVKPEDPISLTAKTIEVALNRLFIANYTKGYNTPTSTTMEVAVLLSPSDPAVALALKSNSSYQVGIRFRDLYGRKSFVVTNPDCVVSIPDRSYSETLYASAITWLLFNINALTEIPDWAYYYDIVITKNLRTTSFVQAYTNTLQYAVKDADGTLIYQNTYTGAAYAIAIDLGILNGIEGIGYTFNEGDICRLYLSTTATIYELEVIGQDGNYVLVKPTDIGSFAVMPGCRFEIFTPRLKSLNETFYTTGQSYKVTNPGTGSRTYSTTSGSISGDVYRVKNAIFNWRYEVMSPDFNHWQDWFLFYGESTTTSLLGQVVKPTFIQWSNVKIDGAQTNGLSTFDGANEKNVPIELGAINKLQIANKIQKDGEGVVMLAVCNSETASLYLGAVQVTGQDRDAFLAQSPEVIGTINVLKNSSGTINPESVVEYLGNVYWIDIINGLFTQYSPNGLEHVSRYKQTRFFKNYCKNYSSNNSNNLDNINGFHHIPTGIDPFYKEVICGLPALIYENYATNLPSYSSVPSYASSIINRFDIFDYLGKTMCFKYEDNYWGSNFEYGAEFYINLDNQLFAFKSGVMYSMNTNTSAYNTFFGTQRPLRVCFTANYNPSLLKTIANICVEGNTIPTFAVAYTDYPNIQITDLASTDDAWENQEGNLYATWLMDRLSPNASGTADQKLFTGDPITGIAMYIMLEFATYNSLVFINFVNISWLPSKGQQNIANPINK